MHFYLFLVHLIFSTFVANLPALSEMGDELYIGVENIIQIDFNNCDPEYVDLKISSGTLIKRSDSTYSVIAQLPEEEVKIKLYYKKVVCQIKTVRFVRLPEPVLTFENVRTSTVSRKEIDKLGKLTLEYPSSLKNIPKTNILSFNVYIQDTGGRHIFSTYTRGEKLDNNTINMLAKVAAGSKLTINNVITQSASIGARNVQGELGLSITD